MCVLLLTLDLNVFFADGFRNVFLFTLHHFMSADGTCGLDCFVHDCFFLADGNRNDFFSERVRAGHSLSPADALNFHVLATEFARLNDGSGKDDFTQPNSAKVKLTPLDLQAFLG